MGRGARRCRRETSDTSRARCAAGWRQRSALSLGCTIAEDVDDQAGQEIAATYQLPGVGRAASEESLVMLLKPALPMVALGACSTHLARALCL